MLLVHIIIDFLFSVKYVFFLFFGKVYVFYLVAVKSAEQILEIGL